jgi:Xaa-Pro aminopeptidase
MELPGLHALVAMDVAARADRVRSRFAAASIDALLVTNLRNISYLTGFTGSAAMLVLGADGSVLVTDGRYGDQAEAQLAEAGVDVSVRVGRTMAVQQDLVTAALASAGRVGLEADDVSWSRQRTLASWLGLEPVPTTGLVEAERAVKDAGEVARIEAAANIADAALATLRDRLAERPTERAFAIELDTTMRQMGATGPSFETIIASGPNSALPHHRPDDRVIVEGDLVVCDFGALVDGYASDMTRTFVVGEPSVRQRELLDVVRAAQAAGVAAVAAGVEARAIDTACRNLITDAGLGDGFSHGTGHGVGLDIHEIPFLGTTSTATLVDGNVITVEPGVYIAGFGGVRVEDSVLVTASGCRPLTHHPKDPRCLPSPPTT